MPKTARAETHSSMKCSVTPNSLWRSALAIAAVVWCCGLAGFVVSFVYSYGDGPYKSSNNFSGVWISGIAMLLAVQAACVILVPSATTAVRPRARWWAWVWYTVWMATCGLVILVSLGIALPPQSGWAALWILASGLILLAAWQHRKAAAAQPAVEHAANDVEARIAVGEQQPVAGTTHAAKGASDGRPAQRSSGCSKAGLRRCCKGCGSCLAWSSLFWGAVLGLFLVLQAANLAQDQLAFPPPGRLVETFVTTAAGDQVPVKLHIFCTGPITPGLATFVLQAGGGSPGITMAGIADGLAAGSRRACWYDGLGYGWSDDAFKPTTTDRSTEALEGLLSAVPDLAPPPYILVGHSVGGQLAMHFADTFGPNKVAGLALLDSYSDVAIYLYMMRGAGASMATHQVEAPNGTAVSLPDTAAHYRRVLPILDLLRAVTPLAWARWITSGGKTGKYGPASAALYGNNKEWHAQWVEVSGLASSGATLADSLTISSGRILWEGAGWRDFSPMPVLLLPAEQTLLLPPACQGVGADYTASAECVNTLQQPQARCEDAAHGNSGAAFNKCMADSVYASLYAAYKATLSSNTTLHVLPGGHGTVTESPDTAVEQLLTKFGGL